MRVGLDLFGSDHHPGVEVAAIRLALERDDRLEIVAFGAPAEGLPVDGERVRLVHAPEGVPMGMAPAEALRSLPQSSMGAGMAALAREEIDAFVSAGNTGAMLAFGIKHLRRLPGVPRPAIAVILPGEPGERVLLDAGANADCRPDHLVGFARVGAAVARAALGRENPRIGLLNIGEEAGKGDTLRKAAFEALSERVAGFVGNVEPTALLTADVDVVVADGFTGNVALKTLEGAASFFGRLVKRAFRANAAASVGGLLARSSLQREFATLDYERYGGSLLAGLEKPVIIAHGRSSPEALANAMLFGARVAAGDVPGAVRAALAAEPASSASGGRAADEAAADTPGS